MNITDNKGILTQHNSGNSDNSGNGNNNGNMQLREMLK